jgi:hypothetical protein
VQFKRLFDSLISCFKKHNVRYCVLRGYENLPYSYSNDIDFGIYPDDFQLFITALVTFKNENAVTIKISTSRLDVLKISVFSGIASIDLDFWFGFNYAGIYYMDIRSMLENCMLHRGIQVLCSEDEISLSFLKELLHMSRLRKDKVDNLLLKLGQCNEHLFSHYFNKKYALLYMQALREKQFDLNQLSRRSKIFLIKSNIQRNGLTRLARNVLTFMLYRIAPNINPLVFNLKVSVDMDSTGKR